LPRPVSLSSRMRSVIPATSPFSRTEPSWSSAPTRHRRGSPGSRRAPARSAHSRTRPQPRLAATVGECVCRAAGRSARPRRLPPEGGVSAAPIASKTILRCRIRTRAAFDPWLRQKRNKAEHRVAPGPPYTSSRLPLRRSINSESPNDATFQCHLSLWFDGSLTTCATYGSKRACGQGQPQSCRYTRRRCPTTHEYRRRPLRTGGGGPVSAGTPVPAHGHTGLLRAAVT
jgi:hypothetical protein